MPLYLCNAAKGALSDEAKSKIAADITRIHCEVTGAPPVFVHAFFLEEAPNQPLEDNKAFVFASIRAGRTEAQKEEIIDGITDSFRSHALAPSDKFSIVIADTPASWVMEGGDIFPEPGEEAAWLEAHEAKRAQEA